MPAKHKHYYFYYKQICRADLCGKIFQPNSLLQAKRNLVLKNVGLCYDPQRKKKTIDISKMYKKEAWALQIFLVFYSLWLKTTVPAIISTNHLVKSAVTDKDTICLVWFISESQCIRRDTARRRLLNYIDKKIFKNVNYSSHSLVHTSYWTYLTLGSIFVLGVCQNLQIKSCNEFLQMMGLRHLCSD